MNTISKYIKIFSINIWSARVKNMGYMQKYFIHSLIFFLQTKDLKNIFDRTRKGKFRKGKFLKNEELLNRLKVSDFEWQESGWMLSDQIIIFALLHINAKKSGLHIMEWWSICIMIVTSLRKIVVNADVLSCFNLFYILLLQLLRKFLSSFRLINSQ